MTLPIRKSKHTVRASAALTSSYVAGTVFSIDEHNYLGILVKYTKGDETSMQVRVESSIDNGVSYGQRITETTSGGTITGAAAEHSFSATGNYWIVVSPIKADTIRISVKATGGTPTGTASIEAITSWV